MDLSALNLRPLGAFKNKNSLSFSLMGQNISSAFVHLFHPHYGNKIETIPLHYDHNGVWRAETMLYPPDTEYMFEVDQREVLDPYAKALSTPNSWGVWRRNPRCQLTYDHSFDFEGAVKPKIAKENLLIYEMHVRGFTKDPSSDVSHPGTFLGLIEKIPYLRSLGINAVELLPVFEFDETESSFVDPVTGRPLANYWGYATMNFFSPMKRYASSEERLSALTEFKTLVKELHRNQIEIILDVVYNHVSLSSCLDLIDKEGYFILSHGEHTNFTGCGNTISANGILGLNLILSSLRYFANECQVDGFRFDLGGALTRGPSGEVLQSPPLFQLIQSDPLLQDVKWLAEPWDCGCLNLQNHFPCKGLLEWDGNYKRVTRQFVHKTYENMHDFLKVAYPSSAESLKIHYITCHDGFSLRDLVSYETKHNEHNGESNRDGESYNFSCNYGVEGPTADPNIEAIRKLQMKNFLFINLFSFGIPMLTMGDEYGLTHLGNNNPYCQDTPINWVHWNKIEEEKELVEFTAKLHQIRKTVQWFPYPPITNVFIEHRSISFLIQDRFLIALNPFENPIEIAHAFPGNWNVLLATNPLPDQTKISLPKYTCLIACRT